jgi:hypothetical protein
MANPLLASDSTYETSFLRNENTCKLQVQNLTEGIRVLERLAGALRSRAALRSARKVSSAGRGRIAEAQRGRWAKIRAEKAT